MRDPPNGAFLLLLGLFVFHTCIQARFIIPVQQYQPPLNDSLICASSDLPSWETRLLSSESHTGDEPAVTLRLYGSTLLGYYYITLFFGTPVQRQNLIVDTGSTITTIPCTGCASACGPNHLNSQFDPALSTSHIDFTCKERFGNYMCSDCTTHCHFEISYTEGSSYQGHFIKDYVVFGDDIEDEYFKNRVTAQENSKSLRSGSGSSSTEQDNSTSESNSTIEALIDKRKIFMPFGCTLKETNLFYSQEADGILGLGVHTNNDRIPPNVIDVFGMSKEGAINAFSICYAAEGGLFTIGGYNTSHHARDETIEYIPFHSESGQYRVNLDRIEFEGKALGLSQKTLNSGQGAFFDSGTTLSYAPPDTVEAIKSALESYCDQRNDNCGGNKRRGECWEYNPDDYATIEDFFDSFGAFAFYFGESALKKYEWRPEDYLYQESPDSLWFCFGLDTFKGRTILGGTFMKNHDVLFDKSQKRLGFIRADCSVELPEWSFTTKTTDNVLFDNIKAVCIILVAALIIYGLLRVHRSNREAERVPTSNTDAPESSSPKANPDPNFRHQEMVEITEDQSIPRIGDIEDIDPFS